MRRSLAIAIALAPATVRAEPRGPCEADVCEGVAPKRPWVLTDDCRDTTDVLGHRRCPGYGGWRASAEERELALEVGIGLRHVAAPRPVVTDAVAPRIADTGTPMADIVTTELRITTAWQSFYLGGELTIGDLSHRTYPYGAFVQGGGVVGFAAAVGPFDLGAEAAAGGRSTRLTTNINRRAPAVTEAIIEARVRAALWLSPWMTITAEAGSGVLDRSEWVAAVGVGIHTRAFGGRR